MKKLIEHQTFDISHAYRLIESLITLEQPFYLRHEMDERDNHIFTFNEIAPPGSEEDDCDDCPEGE